MRRFIKLEDFSEKRLWKLREQIVLNSLYVADYRNDMYISEKSCCDFFDGYMEYLGELAVEKFGDNVTIEQIFSFDNKENLANWHGCFECFSWVEYVRYK